jgi:hypothetical protein
VTLEVFVREYPYVGGHVSVRIKDRMDAKETTSWRWTPLFIGFGPQLEKDA